MKLLDRIKHTERFKRVKEDKGASNTVSFIMIMLVVMVMLVSFIDVGIYFNAKNELRAAAENGARNVALYGGTEGNLRAHKAGVSDAEAIVHQSINTNFRPGAATSPVLEIRDISCGPTKTPDAGSEVWCEIEYRYNGLAGDFGLFQLGGGSEVKVRGVAVSEVGVN